MKYPFQIMINRHEHRTVKNYLLHMQWPRQDKEQRTKKKKN